MNGRIILRMSIEQIRKHGEDVAVASQKKNECVVMFER